MPDSEKFETEIYHTGLVMTFEWEDRKEYELGKAFLDNLIEYNRGKPVPHDWYYLEAEQLDALYTFRQELKERQKG